MYLCDSKHYLTNYFSPACHILVFEVKAQRDQGS